MKLEATAGRAVEEALAAGAGAAEAYAQDSVGREIRVFDGEVESLTEAGERGVGVRCGRGWLPRCTANASVPATAQPSTVSSPGTAPSWVATKTTRIGPAMKTTSVVTPSTA